MSRFRSALTVSLRALARCSSLLACLLASPNAQACPAPLPPPLDVGPDGVAWVIMRDEVRACLIAVEEDGDSSVVAKWPLAGAQAPVGLVALLDGRVLLVRPEGRRWRLHVRSLEGVERALPVWLPSLPDALVAHPYLPLVGVRMPRADGLTRAWLVDVEAGSIAALGRVPSGAALRFPGDAAVLAVGSTLLVAPGRETPEEDPSAEGGAVP